MKYELLNIPKEVMNHDKIEILDKGYLLSTKDLCGLVFLPELIDAGVQCFKIEGRMKTPQYVACVTKIYRKYIDRALSKEDYIIEEQDQKTLLQVFNRGGFSTGHISKEPNRELVYKEKPGNTGLYLGNISNYNPNKGYVTVHLNDELEIGDTIMVEKEETKYTVSELMVQKENIKHADKWQTVQLGRLKGNINIGDRIYKMASKKLSLALRESYQNKEHKKIPLNCVIIIKKDLPITMEIHTLHCPNTPYQNIHFSISSSILPITAVSNPITVDRVIEQISKTSTTPYYFENIKVILEENLFVPNISSLNELRRNALATLEDTVLSKIKRNAPTDLSSTFIKRFKKETNSIFTPAQEKKVSVLLSTLSLETDYSQLENIDRLYIPLKYFTYSKFAPLLTNLCNKFTTYIYMPTIVKSNYIKLLDSNIEDALDKFKIKGFVVSTLGFPSLVKQYGKDYEFIASYATNIYNTFTIEELHRLRN